VINTFYISARNIGELGNEFNDFQDENVIHKCYIYERNKK